MINFFNKTLQKFRGDKRGLTAVEWALVAGVIGASVLGGIAFINNKLHRDSVTKTIQLESDVIGEALAFFKLAQLTAGNMNTTMPQTSWPIEMREGSNYVHPLGGDFDVVAISVRVLASQTQALNQDDCRALLSAWTGNVTQGRKRDIYVNTTQMTAFGPGDWVTACNNSSGANIIENRYALGS